jgi:hypothetical protein
MPTSTNTLLRHRKVRGCGWTDKSGRHPDDADFQKFIPVIVCRLQTVVDSTTFAGANALPSGRAGRIRSLYRHLTNQPRFCVPALGERKALSIKYRDELRQIMIDAGRQVIGDLVPIEVEGEPSPVWKK